MWGGGGALDYFGESERFNHTMEWRFGDSGTEVGVFSVG